MSADFSVATLQARREWHGAYKVMKTRGLNPKLLYPPRLKQRASQTTKGYRNLPPQNQPKLQEMFKGLV